MTPAGGPHPTIVTAARLLAGGALAAVLAATATAATT